jgi:CRP/FNR family cyclic AMP-dependent transcriptional regulator
MDLWHKIKGIPGLKLAFLFFISAGLIGVFSALTASASISLFLQEYNVTTIRLYLALFLMSTGIATFLFHALYSQLATYFKQIKIVLAVYIFVAAVFMLFLLLSFLAPRALGVLYGWVQITIMALIFLHQIFAANYMESEFNGQNITSLAIALGAMVGGLGILLFLPYVNPINFLYVSVFLLIANGVLYYYIAANTLIKPKKMAITPSNTSMLKRILSNSYINLILGLVVVTAVFVMVANYQLLLVTKDALPGKETVAFLAKLFVSIGIFHIGIQFFCSAWMLGRFGVIKNLFILPALLLAATVALFFKYDLHMLTTLVFTNLALLSSLYRDAFESLFLVLSERLQEYSRTLIVKFVWPGSKILVGFLLLGVTFFSTSSIAYKIILLIAALVWIGLVLLLARQYVARLTDTLSHHYLFSLDFKTVFPKWQKVLSAKSYQAMIIKLLQTADTATQLVLLDLLPNDMLPRLHENILKLLNSSHEQVVLKAIALTGKLNNNNDAQLLRPFFSHVSEAIQEGALIAYAQILKNNAFDVMKKMMDTGNETQKVASLVASYLYCGEIGKQYAQQQFNGIFANNKMLSLKVIAKMKDKDFISYLNILLIDPDKEVRKEALVACQEYVSPELLTNIIQAYAENQEMRTQIRYFMYHVAPAYPAELIRLYQSASYPLVTRSFLLRSLGRINQEEGLSILLKEITKREANELVVAAFEALQIFHFTETYSAQIQAELTHAYVQLYRNILILRQTYQELGDANPAVKVLYFDTLVFYTVLLLQLIDIRYGHANLTRLIDLLLQRQFDLVKDNVQLLETILPITIFNEVKAILVFPLEEPDAKQVLRQYNLIALFQVDSWVADLAVFYAKDKPELSLVLGEYGMKPKDEQFYARLNTIALLKRTDFFKNISANYLLAITELLHAETAYAKEIIVKEGDPADSLFIICEGQVSIQKGNNEIAKLGPGECIGEIAILDKMPRSASAVALTDVKLLRVYANDFSEMLLNFPEIGQNLLTILAQRLRKTLASIT